IPTGPRNISVYRTSVTPYFHFEGDDHDGKPPYELFPYSPTVADWNTFSFLYLTCCTKTALARSSPLNRKAVPLVHRRSKETSYVKIDPSPLRGSAFAHIG